MSIDTLADHETLVNALLDPALWPKSAALQRIDTHISSVLLIGDYAYKIKKPIDLGFLDFSTLDKRRYACDEEIRLNRRLAPDIYLAVVAITGSAEAPSMDNHANPIDWAVKMRRFDPLALLSNPRLQLTPTLIAELAWRIAEFHQQAATVSDERLGTPELAYAAVQENFEQLLRQGWQASNLEELRHWAATEYHRRLPLMSRRRREGHVRECHGDLHLGNIALVDGEPLVFDAIEFNPRLRWIDTFSDLAFLTMDLHYRDRGDLAYRLLDRYLEITGDYAGLPLLRPYEVYRALVRAKVDVIRQAQPEIAVAEQSALREQADTYVHLAENIANTTHPGVVITHGVSGSGKSHTTADLPGQLATIRIRSDVERKRLLNIDPSESAGACGGYSQEATQRTYARLESLAKSICDAGLTALVDATFLRAEYRARLQRLARRMHVPFVIIEFEAPQAVLQSRIRQRAQEHETVSDATQATMQQQLLDREPLSAEELAHRIVVTPEHPLNIAELRKRLNA